MAHAALATRAKSPEAFRTISEVADELDVPQHVLRFWEGRFAQIKPVKRAGGRRYYRPEDVDLLRGIRALLYTEGFTIKGVQKVLRDRGLRHVVAIGQGRTEHAPVIAVPPPAPVAVPPPQPESRVTQFRPRTPRPKVETRRGPDLFDALFSAFPAPVETAEPPAPPVRSVVMEEPHAEPDPGLPSAGALAREERERLEALLAELQELKTRLKNRPKRD